MDHMQNKKQIFVRKQLINADHNFQKLFILQLINCFNWIMNRFLICVRVFSPKKGHFQLKTPVKILSIPSTYYCIIYI